MRFKPNRLRIGGRKFKNNDNSIHFDGNPFQSSNIAFTQKPLISTIIAISGIRRFVWWQINDKDLKPIYNYYVKKGKKLGRKLGYRTCNIRVKNYVLPKPGIYAVKVLIGNQKKLHLGEEYNG